MKKLPAPLRLRFERLPGESSLRLRTVSAAVIPYAPVSALIHSAGGAHVPEPGRIGPGQSLPDKGIIFDFAGFLIAGVVLEEIPVLLNQLRLLVIN